jgi:hypothetical protein
MPRRSLPLLSNSTPTTEETLPALHVRRSLTTPPTTPTTLQRPPNDPNDPLTSN